MNDIGWVETDELIKQIWFEQIDLWWILISLVGLL